MNIQKLQVSNKDIAKIPTNLNSRSHKEQLVTFPQKSERKKRSALGGLREFLLFIFIF